MAEPAPLMDSGPGAASVVARWRDRVAALRNRLLASSRFQRWAAGFPLTRGIARRRSRALFDLCAGFVYTQVLFACVRLDVLTLLGDEGPATPAALATRLSLPLDSTERLLRAAAALDLVEPRAGGRYGLGPQGAVVRGNPGIAAMVDHHDRLYADLADPVALLRGERADTALSRYWPYAESADPTAVSADEVAPYSALMADSQPMIAAEVLEAYPFRKHHRILDVGGGDGAFLIAVAEAVPRLEPVLFDLPAVGERARARFESAGLANRARVVTGDMVQDSLPGDADLVTLVRILHDHDDATALAILRNVHAALPADGTLVVAEPMAGTKGAEAVGDAYFGLYLLAMGRGRPRTPDANADLLRQAGFTGVRVHPTRQPFLTCVMSARRAAR
jgi:demethylspheroidene O-methyltransferase